MIGIRPARVTLFKALGDPTRHLIVQVLSHQELAVHELVDVLGAPQSTISRHLRILREAGALQDRREGQTVYCRAAIDPPGDDAVMHSLWRGFRDEPLPEPIRSRIDAVLTARRRRSSEFFHHRAEEWDDLRTALFGRDFPLEALLGLLPDEWTVIDLGTGTGYLLPALGRTFRRVIAVDHERAMLNRAQSRAMVCGLTNAEFCLAQLEALPIADDTCHLAVAMLVLHHVSEPSRTLAEVARVLEPGGMLLVVELHEHHDEDLRQTMGDLWMGFDPQRLTQMAERAGLTTRRTLELTGSEPRQDDDRIEPKLFACVFAKQGRTHSA